MSVTTKSAYEIILRPIVTEKSVFASNENKYVFEVAKNANKYEIAWAVEQIQRDAKNTVTVVSVNTVTTRGRVRKGRFFKRSNSGFASGYKKAIVTLAPGQQIELVEGV
jgi:large subunit ribosomal protein L23